MDIKKYIKQHQTNIIVIFILRYLFYIYLNNMCLEKNRYIGILCFTRKH